MRKLSVILRTGVPGSYAEDGFSAEDYRFALQASMRDTFAGGEELQRLRVIPGLSRQSPDESMEVPDKNDPEAGWLKAAGEGDLAAFSQLILKHQWSVRAFLLVRLSRKHEAEDLAQETFLTAWKNIGKFDPSRPFAPWLRGIAENHLCNHLRKFRAEPIGGNEALQLILDQYAAAEPSVRNESDLAEAMRECLAGIQGEARELLMSRYAEGRSMAEICASTGKKHSAVTMKLHRLRLALAACVEGRLAQPN